MATNKPYALHYGAQHNQSHSGELALWEFYSLNLISHVQFLWWPVQHGPCCMYLQTSAVQFGPQLVLSPIACYLFAISLCMYNS